MRGVGVWRRESMQRERRTRARRDSSSSPTGTPASLYKMVRSAIVLNLAALDRTYFSIGAGARLGKSYLSTPPAAQSPGRARRHCACRGPGGATAFPDHLDPPTPHGITRRDFWHAIAPGRREPGSGGARSLARQTTGVPQSSHRLGQGVRPRSSIGQVSDRFPRPARVRGRRPDSAAQHTSTTHANPDVRSDAVRIRQTPP